MDKKIRILIVDQNENYCRELTRFLTESPDIEVIGNTGDGARALEMISARKTDFVITDILLSSLDGIGLLSNISTLPRDKRPVTFVVSGFTSDHVLSTAAALGAGYYFQKPTDPQLIRDRIRQFHDDATAPQRTLANIVSPIRSEQSVESLVTDVIHEIGIPSHIKGYMYLRKAIMLAIEDMSVINAVTKVLYPTVAEAFNTTASRVERAIRHAIELAWDRGDVEILHKMFGYTVSNMKGKPTNSEFISLIADKLKLKLDEAKK